RRGQLEESLLYAHRALECCENHVDRDRILADMATTLAAMGHREAARDAHVILASTAEEQEIRWIATINLLELATLAGSEPMFERYRAQLRDAKLPPALAAYYHLHVGEGCGRFERYERAQSALQAAITVAEQHGVNEVLMRAEAALANVRQVQRDEACLQPTPTPAVAEVIRAMSGLRAAVGTPAP
ncbi:MAG: hypothetical protein ACRENI_14025, partial [Gemmatimonadaceae bacterium]